MKKLWVFVGLMGACATLPDRRVPAANKEGCADSANLILNLFPEEMSAELASFSRWKNRSGTLSSRGLRILKGASQQLNLRSVADKFFEDPDQIMFRKFVELAANDPLERLRLALLADRGLDLADPLISKKAQKFLLDLTQNEFPGEALPRSLVRGGKTRFPRFIPAFHDESQPVQILLPHDAFDLRDAMKEGISSVARRHRPANLESLETQLARDSDLFYEVSRPDFAGRYFQENFLPFVRAFAGSVTWKTQIEKKIEEVSEGNLSAFTLYRIKSQLAVPDFENGENFVFEGMVEPEQIIEAFQIKNSPGGVIISKITRQRDGRLKTEAGALADLFR